MAQTNQINTGKMPKSHTFRKKDVIFSEDEKQLRQLHLKHAVELGKDARSVTLMVATVNQILRMHTRILHITNTRVLLSDDVIVPIAAVQAVIFV